MGNLFIVAGSVTSANRLNRLLSDAMSVKIIHTPVNIGGGGCSYSVVTKLENFDKVKRIIVANNIKVKGYYAEKDAGGEKGYYALS